MSFLTTDDGVRLRYVDRGEGPAIVLVHGWKGSHRLWDQTIPRLERSHRMVAFDLRGMGESDKPRCRYDFDVLSSDLGFVIGELGLDDVTLVGWSMGCTVSLRYLERGGEGVARLALVNGPLRLTRSDDFPHTMTEEEFNGYVDEVERGWPASEYEFQASSLAAPDPALAGWLYSIALQTPLPIVLEVVREQAKLDMREALRRLEIPVLAAYSAGDPYYPTALSDYIAEICPHGERVVLTGSGHYPQLEEPERFAEVIGRFASGESAA